MTFCIFSIDKVGELRQQRKFLKYVDELRAMNKLKGEVKSCIGMYEGTMELSWICLASDFEEFFASSGYVDNQQSVLYLDSKRRAFLAFSNGDVEVLGRMKDVPMSKAWQNGAFTYRPDMDKYFIAE